MTRVLCLSGGGALGAYEVGALQALVEAGKSWDVVVGVSVGALNAGMIAQYHPELQTWGVQRLLNIWQSIQNNKAVYKPHAPWFLKYIWGLWKSSIYSMHPLKNIIDINLSKQALKNSGVELRVGTCSLTTGKYHLISSKTTENMNDWIYASCIFPALFEPVEINGEDFVDGGIRTTIPISDVLDLKPSCVDVILTQPVTGYIKATEKKKSFVNVGLRVAQIMSEQIYLDDLNYPNVSVYAPKNILNYDGFEFNKDTISKLIELGYNETKEKPNVEKRICTF